MIENRMIKTGLLEIDILPCDKMPALMLFGAAS